MHELKALIVTTFLMATPVPLAPHVCNSHAGVSTERSESPANATIPIPSIRVPRVTDPEVQPPNHDIVARARVNDRASATISSQARSNDIVKEIGGWLGVHWK